MRKFGLKQVALFTITVMGPLFACSSSTTGSGTDGGANPDGGASGGYKQCPVPGSTCKASEEEAYGNCILSKCETQYAKCFGSAFKTGNFAGGPCGTYVGCIQKCGCNDTACYTACGQPDQACQSCLTTDVNSCVQNSGCTVPACISGGVDAGGGDGGGGTGCADLSACCAQIADASAKQGCQTIASSGNASTCSQALAGYKSAGLCN